MKRKFVPPQRWIELLIGELSTNSPEESLLPKGEGQDVGELRSMTQRRVGFCEGPSKSFYWLTFTLPLTPTLSPWERKKLWHGGMVKSRRLNSADGSWRGKRNTPSNKYWPILS